MEAAFCFQSKLWGVNKSYKEMQTAMKGKPTCLGAVETWQSKVEG